MTVSDMESLAVQHVCSLESLLGHVWHDPYDSAVDSAVNSICLAVSYCSREERSHWSSLQSFWLVNLLKRRPSSVKLVLGF